MSSLGLSQPTILSNKDRLVKYLIDWKHGNPGKRFPTFQEIEASTHMKKYQISNILTELVKEGKIRRNYAQYKLPEAPQPAIKKIESRIRNFQFNTISVFKIFIFIIGIIATAMSVYYNSFGFDDTVRTVGSWILSFCFVTFAVICFEAIILFFIKASRKHPGYYSLSLVFFVLWMIVISFNMINIMAGQRNQYQVQLTETTRTDEAGANYMVFQNVVEQEKEYKRELENRVTERDRLERIEDPKPVNRINRLNAEIKAIQEKVREVREEKIRMLKAAPVKKVESGVNFSEWIAGILRMAPDTVQVVLYLMRAILLDIMVSISFALCLFLKNEDFK